MCLVFLGVHVNKGNFTLWYIFWCPPSTHDKSVHICEDKCTKIGWYMGFCPQLVGCPRKTSSTVLFVFVETPHKTCLHL